MTIKLQRFCATESDVREYMRAPGRRGEFVYATNGYMAVRVPAADAPDAPEFPADVLKHMPGLFDFPDSLTWLSLPDFAVAPCSRCGGSCTLRVETCESCDGNGEFDRDGYEYECKACDGEGFTESHRGKERRECPNCCGRGHEGRQTQQLGDGAQSVYVDAGFLSWLARLPGIVMSLQEPTQVVRFRFDGGLALLIPVRL